MVETNKNKRLYNLFETSGTERDAYLQQDFKVNVSCGQDILIKNFAFLIIFGKVTSYIGINKRRARCQRKNRKRWHICFKKHERERNCSFRKIFNLIGNVSRRVQRSAYEFK